MLAGYFRSGANRKRRVFLVSFLLFLKEKSGFFPITNEFFRAFLGQKYLVGHSRIADDGLLLSFLAALDWRPFAYIIIYIPCTTIFPRPFDGRVSDRVARENSC